MANAMKISLIRHGRPAVDLSTRIRAADFSAWLDAYEAAGIDPSLPPPDSLSGAFAHCGLMIASPARRAVESARLLEIDAETVTVSAAAEIPLPTRLRCPIGLRPGAWVVIARILWLLKLARAREDRRQATERIRGLACDLGHKARAVDHVVLVGHGYTNIFLGKALAAEGWRACTRPTHGYWSCTHYEKTGG